MLERNIDLAKAKELICGGRIDNNGKADINWIELTDEFQNEERGNRRKTTKAGLKLRMKRALACFDVKPKPRNAEQLFRTYSELHFNETMEKGGQQI